MDWNKAQEWERDWWSTCTNTLGEELKQLLYASRMGLKAFHDGKSPYNFDLDGASVLDIGGGPCSLLLKCVNFTGAVLDPLLFPDWVMRRYHDAGVSVFLERGERMNWLPEFHFDECWLYNVLQHTEDPALVLKNARQVGGLIRLFEWIDTPTNEGHPHTLTEAWLNEQLKGEGKVEELTGRNECFGTAYYGIFPA